jgi:hypothetical protein
MDEKLEKYYRYIVDDLIGRTEIDDKYFKVPFMAPYEVRVFIHHYYDNWPIKTIMARYKTDFYNYGKSMYGIKVDDITPLYEMFIREFIPIMEGIFNLSGGS